MALVAGAVAKSGRGKIEEMNTQLAQTVADTTTALALGCRAEVEQLLAFTYRGQARFYMGDAEGAIADLDRALALKNVPASRSQLPSDEKQVMQALLHENESQSDPQQRRQQQAKQAHAAARVSSIIGQGNSIALLAVKTVIERRRKLAASLPSADAPTADAAGPSARTKPRQAPSLDPQKMAEVMLRASGLLQAKQYDRALSLTDEYIARHPSDPNGYLNRVIVRIHVGYPVNAVRDLETVKSLLATYSEWLLALEGPGLVDALECKCWAFTGQAYALMGDYKTALAASERALQIVGRCAALQQQKALIEQQRRVHAEILEVVKKADALGGGGGVGGKAAAESGRRKRLRGVNDRT